MRPFLQVLSIQLVLSGLAILLVGLQFRQALAVLHSMPPEDLLSAAVKGLDVLCSDLE